MAELPWETGSRDMQFIVGLGASAWSAKKSFKYNQRLIKMQQDWQERMSNTAHQREVADLRAAGLNPILSATGGSGASFGSASAPSMTVENPVEAGYSAMNAFQQHKLLKQEVATGKSQENLNDKNAHVSEALWDKTQEEANNAYETGLNLMKERQKMDVDMDNSKQITKAQVDLMEKQGRAELINAGANSARSQSEVQYNRRRASGYSETTSNTVSGGANFGRHGIGGSGSLSRSRSRTW